MTHSERVEAWIEQGIFDEFRGRSIYVHMRVPDDPAAAPGVTRWRDQHRGPSPLILLLHGYPLSSYSWQPVLERGLGHPALAFDFLGFGLSDKPPTDDYDLIWQADLTEDVVSRHGEARRVFVVAQDMGSSVATELIARDIEGCLEMDLCGALLFNGSIVQAAASPTGPQRLLRGPGGRLIARLAGEWAYRRALGSVFSPQYPISREQAEDHWKLFANNGGHRLGHRLISYVAQREELAERWHGALRDWPKPVKLAWGMADPLATGEVLRAVRGLRPSAPTTELPMLGHYPQIEDPERMAAIVRDAVDASL